MTVNHTATLNIKIEKKELAKSFTLLLSIKCVSGYQAVLC